MKSKIFIFCIVFLIVYGPVLDTPLGSIVDLSFFVCLAIMFFGLLGKSPIYSNQFVNQLILFLLIIFTICIANAVLLDSNGVSESIRPILRPIRVIPVIFGIAIFARYVVIKSGDESVNILMLMLYLAITLHAIIMIVQFFNADFRNAIYEFTTAKNVLQIYQATRMAGLTGAGGAQLSIVQSSGLIIGVYLFVQSTSKKNKIFIFLTCQLIILSVFMAGRSGFITALLFCPLYFIYLNSLISIRKMLKTLFLISIFVISTLSLLVYLLFDILSSNPSFVSAFERIFDSFLAYNRGGEVKVNTIDRLLKMFIIPEETLHLLFGKASYLNNNTTYDIETDIGYFRLIWGYGIIGSLFHYAFYLFAILRVSNLKNLTKSVKSLPIVLLLLILFFNTKEILVFSRLNLQISMLALFIVYFSSHESKRLKERKGIDY